MAKKKHCYLLDLPLELRDMIYTYLTVQYPVEIHQHRESSEPTNMPNAITVMESPTVNLLLVNRQIAYEYLETTSKLMELNIMFDEYMEPSTTITFRPQFPLALLSRFRFIKVWVHWSMVAGDERAYPWVREHSLFQLRNQQNLQWTPSKRMYQPRLP